MRYSPKPRRGFSAAGAFFGLLLSFALMYSGARLGQTFVFALLSLSSLLFSMQLFFRFSLVRYIYILDDGNLTVYTSLGKKENRIFDLSLLLAEGVADRREGRRLKKNFGKISRRFNACQNFFPKKKYHVVYNNGVRMSVCIECDEKFAYEIKKLIPSRFV